MAILNTCLRVSFLTMTLIDFHLCGSDYLKIAILINFEISMKSEFWLRHSNIFLNVTFRIKFWFHCINFHIWLNERKFLRFVLCYLMTPHQHRWRDFKKEIVIYEMVCICFRLTEWVYCKYLICTNLFLDIEVRK